MIKLVTIGEYQKGKSAVTQERITSRWVSLSYFGIMLLTGFDVKEGLGK